MKGFNTKAIHGIRFKQDVHGALRVPVYETVSFELGSSRDLQLAFEGKKPAHAYSRISNPTVEDFEQKVRLISGSFAVLALSSGMAAISNLVMTLCEMGTNVVTSKNLFGNTVSLFEHSLKPWGLEVKYVDMTNADEVKAAIDEDTRLVFCENITNPQLEVVNIKEIAEITKAAGVPFAVDCTVTTPYLFNSKEHGVNVEIISSTKYMSGGATSVGGVIIDNGNFDWKTSTKLADKARKMGPMALMATLRTQVYRNLGACLSPHSAAQQALGLETLSLRIKASCHNAQAVAEYLDDHPKVAHVNYPGLKNSPQHELAKEQFPNGFGGILTLDLGSQEECYQFMDALTLIKRSTNLNDNKSMIIHPASTIFCEYSPTKKIEMGVPDTLLRLSVGIEDFIDLQEDIAKALETL
ncbi:MAG: PLP-dependent transferase [SAR324 cluster bacterium]|nr:PLP-dependent transferase [SAR324 cluster bacterium]